MSAWIIDLRGAARALRRAPGFAIAAIFTIALGIASVTVVYALVDAVLLEPLNLPAPERILAVHRRNSDSAHLSLPDVIALRERLKSFEAIATLAPDVALDRSDGDVPERVRAALVEADYFRVIGLPPLLGRVLRKEDDVPGAASVVVLGASYWRSHFGGDPGVIGRRLRLSDVSVQIVGVIDDRADLLEIGTAIWAPLPPFAPWAPSSPGSNTFEAVARFAANSSLATARAELHTVSKALAQENGNPDKILGATGWVDFVTADARQGIWMLFAAVALLLMLATANVAAMVLVRSTRRRAELSLRHALGASRQRLLRLQLSEGLLLGLIGGVLGVLIALLSFEPLRAQAGALPRLHNLSIDGSVLLVAMLSTLFSAVLFSALPAWRVRTQGSAGRLNGIGQQRGDARTLASLITLEVALACALLGAAGLLTRSFLALSAIPLGFDANAVITAGVVLPESRYAQIEAQNRAFTSMVRALATEAGVSHAALVVGPPLLAAQGISHTLLVDGQVLDDASARYRPIVGDYFAAMGMNTVAGRGVQAGDDSGERVAWVNQTFVRRYLQGVDPIGTRIAWKPGEAGAATEPLWMRVLGVVADVRGGTLRSDDAPSVYAPYAQREANWIRSGTLVARVAGDPTAYRDALTQAVAVGDNALAIGEISTMLDRSARALSTDRYLLQLVALFATLALALGIQGVYSVVAFAVEQRRSEIGVRLALGASPAQAVRTLIQGTLPPILLGTALGLGLTLLAGQLLANVLFGVGSFDPATLLLTAILLIVCGLCAAWIPARRAQRIAPGQTLLS